MTETEYTELANKLGREYFLIKTYKIWYLLGGAAAALVATGLITYQATISAAKDKLLDEATRQQVVEIQAFHAMAKEISGEISAIRDKHQAQLDVIEIYMQKTDDVFKSQKYVLTNQLSGCPDNFQNIGRIGFLIEEGKTSEFGQGSNVTQGWDYTHPFICRRVN